MTNRIFNSTFENSLRLLLLLYEYDMPQTLDMLYAVDFMTLYSKEFGITDQNLNGDNIFKFSEFASQRELIKEALKELVLTGTAQAVSYKDGLSYIITPEGEDYCESLMSDYASDYRSIAKKIMEAVNGKSERQLITKIYQMSDKSFSQEVDDE